MSHAKGVTMDNRKHPATVMSLPRWGNCGQTKTIPQILRKPAAFLFAVLCIIVFTLEDEKSSRQVTHLTSLPMHPRLKALQEAAWLRRERKYTMEIYCKIFWKLRLEIKVSLRMSAATTACDCCHRCDRYKKKLMINLAILTTAIRVPIRSRYWTGTSLEWRLIRGNIIALFTVNLAHLHYNEI